MAQSTHIFISFSMPRASILQWIEQAEKTQSSVHLRGFVNNSFKETMQVSNELLKNNQNGGLLLDPKLFEHYHIQTVPAVVFVEDNQEPVIVYGDIGLKAAAEMALARVNLRVARKVLDDLNTT